MPANENAEEKSGLRAFWTSLPGVLTGLAAVIGAVATLAALFLDDAGNGSRAADPPIAGQAGGASAASAAPGEGSEGAAVSGCFAQYFKAIARDRTGSVEVGTNGYDVIRENQTKTGPVGLRLTNNGRSIGALQVSFFKANGIFKIASVVDERCRTIESYSNPDGGDKHVIANYNGTEIRLGNALYSLILGGDTKIRVVFSSVVP